MSEINIIGEKVTCASEIKFDTFLDCTILNLHANQLCSLSGFPRLCNLMYLNLSSNSISTFNMPELSYFANLISLDLSANLIASIQDAPYVPTLKHLSVAYNIIIGLNDIDLSFPFLESLDCRHNRIESQDSILTLAKLKYLNNLDVTGLGSSHHPVNPICNSVFTMARLFDDSPSLKLLDGRDCNYWRDQENAKMMLMTEDLLANLPRVEANHDTLDEMKPLYIAPLEFSRGHDQPLAQIATPKFDIISKTFKSRAQSNNCVKQPTQVINMINKGLLIANSTIDPEYAQSAQTPSSLQNKIDLFMKTVEIKSSRASDFNNVPDKTSELLNNSSSITEIDGTLTDRDSADTHRVQNAATNYLPDNACYQEDIHLSIQHQATQPFTKEPLSATIFFYSLRHLYLGRKILRLTFTHLSMCAHLKKAQLLLEESNTLKGEINKLNSTHMTDLVRLQKSHNQLMSQERNRTEMARKNALTLESLNNSLRHDVDRFTSNFSKLQQQYDSLQLKYSEECDRFQNVDAKLKEMELKQSEVLFNYKKLSIEHDSLQEECSRLLTAYDLKLTEILQINEKNNDCKIQYLEEVNDLKSQLQNSVSEAAGLTQIVENNKTLIYNLEASVYNLSQKNLTLNEEFIIANASISKLNYQLQQLELEYKDKINSMRSKRKKVGQATNLLVTLVERQKHVIREMSTTESKLMSELADSKSALQTASQQLQTVSNQVIVSDSSQNELNSRYQLLERRNLELSSDLNRLQSSLSEIETKYQSLSKSFSDLQSESKIKEKVLQDQNIIVQDLRQKLSLYDSEAQSLRRDRREFEMLLDEARADIAEMEKQLNVKSEIELNLSNLTEQFKRESNLNPDSCAPYTDQNIQPIISSLKHQHLRAHDDFSRSSTDQPPSVRQLPPLASNEYDRRKRESVSSNNQLKKLEADLMTCLEEKDAIKSEQERILSEMQQKMSGLELSIGDLASKLTSEKAKALLAAESYKTEKKMLLKLQSRRENELRLKEAELSRCRQIIAELKKSLVTLNLISLNE